MLGLQLPPFLDFLGVVLQMGAHDAFHEAREVGSSISQSADNEVGALLCRPTQIDCPTFDQLGGDEESLLVSVPRLILALMRFGVSALSVCTACSDGSATCGRVSPK